MKKFSKPLFLIFALFLIFISRIESIYALSEPAAKSQLIRTLIVDGQNNHDQWPKITFMMKDFLEQSGKFKVDVQRSHFTWNAADLIPKYMLPGLENTVALAKPKADSSFLPKFSDYDLVICNFGWNAAPWPAETQVDFEKFMKKGGGLVVIHAADNSFPQWPAYNEMIGLGGWGDRTEKDGPYVYYDLEGKLVKDTQAGRAGSHGPQKEYQITIRNVNHPITKGMPLTWMHTQDEMYDRLRGPAVNMEILGTAFSAKENRGTGRHEPMLIVTQFGKGRVFHTPMGHADYSVSCVGFITTLLRGAQWAATGKVDIPIPADFPKADVSSKREYSK